MLDIKFIRENPELVKKAARDKRFDVDIDGLIARDEQRRDLLYKSEQVRARRNEVASSIKGASREDRPALIAEGKELKEQLSQLEESLGSVTQEFQELLLMVPNVPIDEVPVGAGEEDNVEVRKVGTPRAFDFTPRDHEELGAAGDPGQAARHQGRRRALLPAARRRRAA